MDALPVALQVLSGKARLPLTLVKWSRLLERHPDLPSKFRAA